MKRFRKRSIEIAFVLVTLCGILSITIPAFFRSQDAQTPALVYDGLARVLNAIQRYQNEHQHYPAPVSEGRQDTIWNKDGVILFNNLNYDYMQFFLHPAAPDGLDLPSDWVDLQYSQRCSFDVISVFPTSSYKSVVVAVVANLDNITPSEDVLVKRYHFEAGQAMMKPEFYYAPSNGLISGGFFYLDIFGNHSPWTRPPTVELVGPEIEIERL